MRGKVSVRGKSLRMSLQALIHRNNGLSRSTNVSQTDLQAGYLNRFCPEFPI
jgi:hypothetical protein